MLCSPVNRPSCRCVTGHAGAHFTAGFNEHQVLTRAEPVSQMTVAPASECASGHGLRSACADRLPSRTFGTIRPWVASIIAAAGNPY